MVQLSVYQTSTWIYEYFYIFKYFFNPCIPFSDTFSYIFKKGILNDNWPIPKAFPLSGPLLHLYIFCNGAYKILTC
jgi:hypothetical protein